MSRPATTRKKRSNLAILIIGVTCNPPIPSGQFADIPHQGVDLIVAQAALEWGHLTRPIGNDLGQLRVRLLVHVRSAQIRYPQTLANGRFAASVLTVTTR